MNVKNICGMCSHKNEQDNFLCSECGFYLDMEISINSSGLPEINNKL